MNLIYDKMIVAIDYPQDEVLKKILESSLVFINLSKRLPDKGNRFWILLYDCRSTSDMNNRLDYLNESSGVDFKFGYKFV